MLTMTPPCGLRPSRARRRDRQSRRCFAGPLQASPLEGLPEGFQVAAQFNPLYQLVELVRGAAFGFEAVDLIRVAVLAGFSFVMWRVAVHQMAKRLID